ncbi:MAG TPA: hypothetical protein VLQ29_08075 [Candidatus Dormibacteraeota bacterium]|nr:hypothetical protein [Candidatus Dormibacteraeota bacterium]
MIIHALLNHLSGPQNGKWVKWKKRSRAGIESVVSASTRCFLILAVSVIPAVAQTPSEQINQLPSQARQVHGVAVPVPKEIFRSLDQFRDANWRVVKRPEIAGWKSHGDQAQIATLLGIVIAEGFIAMEAEDSTEVKNLGRTVLTLARGLGVEERALRRSRSIMELADKNEWTSARQEWDAVFSDIEGGMIELKSTKLAQLVSVGGWLRGAEALSALLLQKYSPERSALIRQPVLVDYLEKQLVAMNSDIQGRPMVVKLLDGIRRIRTPSENGPLAEETVRKVHGICKELVPLASRRLD